MFCPLAGPIPPELGNLGALMKLSLQENELTGEFKPLAGVTTSVCNLL